MGAAREGGRVEVSMGGTLRTWKGLAAVCAGDPGDSDRLGMISRVAEERG